MARSCSVFLAILAVAPSLACGTSGNDSPDDASNTATTDDSTSESQSATSEGETSTPSTSTSSTSFSTTEEQETEAKSFAEMCASPSVIFCDDFEDMWDSAWIEDGGDVRIVAGAALAGEGNTVVELATYADRQSSKLIRTFAPSEELYIRFDVHYDPTYDNSGGSHGPILGGSSAPPWGLLGTAGIKPEGDDHFVLNFEPLGTVKQGGEFGFYAYFANMQPDGHGDFWGNVFRSDVEPPPVIIAGQWHCAEYGLKLNTVGSEDGRAEFWVDGVHHGSFDGFSWRTSAELALNTFVLDSYNHFNNGAPAMDKANLVRYDNLVISTAPVGCLTANRGISRP